MEEMYILVFQNILHVITHIFFGGNVHFITPYQNSVHVYNGIKNGLLNVGLVHERHFSSVLLLQKLNCVYEYLQVKISFFCVPHIGSDHGIHIISSLLGRIFLYLPQSFYKSQNKYRKAILPN